MGALRANAQSEISSKALPRLKCNDPFFVFNRGMSMSFQGLWGLLF